MAEALDVLFDVSKFLEAHGGGEEAVAGSRSGSKTVERINLTLLALGKATDLVADWVIMAMVLRLTHGASGCTNACEYARNWVCQDGEGVTPASSVTLCDDCGPRPSLAAATVYPLALQLIAVAIALAGTAIELLAGYLKVRLMLDAREKEAGSGTIAYMIHTLNLNRRLALPRFLLDDLPATLLSVYILAVFPDEADASTVVLLVVSVAYSTLAMAYHCCRSIAGEDEETYQRLREAKLDAADVRQAGLPLADARKVGYTTAHLMQAGYVIVFEGHSSGVTSVCSLGGQVLASGSGDKTVRLWDAATGACTRTLTGHSSFVFSVCSLGGQVLASGSDDKTVRLWDAAESQLDRLLVA